MSKNQFSKREHIIRSERLKWFKKELLPIIALEFDVEIPQNHSYKVLDTPQGDIFIYPKGRKIYLVDKKTWVLDNFLEWIKRNLIKEEVSLKKQAKNPYLGRLFD